MCDWNITFCRDRSECVGPELIIRRLKFKENFDAQVSTDSTDPHAKLLHQRTCMKQRLGTVSFNSYAVQTTCALLASCKLRVRYLNILIQHSQPFQAQRDRCKCAISVIPDNYHSHFADEP